MANNGTDDVFFGPPAKWAEFKKDGSLYVFVTEIKAAQVEAFIEWVLAHRPIPEVGEEAAR